METMEMVMHSDANIHALRRDVIFAPAGGPHALLYATRGSRRARGGATHRSASASTGVGTGGLRPWLLAHRLHPEAPGERHRRSTPKTSSSTASLGKVHWRSGGDRALARWTQRIEPRNVDGASLYHRNSRWRVNGTAPPPFSVNDISTLCA